MSEKLIPVAQVPPKRGSKWQKEFMAIPFGKAKPYSGDRARAAWVAFHKLKKENKIASMLTIRAERIRNVDALVWVYWKEAA